MFEDGLHNRVDIYQIDRTPADKMGFKIKLSEFPFMENVPCRIIKDEKVIFAGELKLSDAYAVKDLESGNVYEIKDRKIVKGIGEAHHSTYNVRIKKASGLHG